jgi:hypothetical protein
VIWGSICISIERLVKTVATSQPNRVIWRRKHFYCRILDMETWQRLISIRVADDQIVKAHLIQWVRRYVPFIFLRLNTSLSVDICLRRQHDKLMTKSFGGTCGPRELGGFIPFEWWSPPNLSQFFVGKRQRRLVTNNRLDGFTY